MNRKLSRRQFITNRRETMEHRNPFKALLVVGLLAIIALSSSTRATAAQAELDAYSIVSVRSDKCIDVEDASTENHANIQQYTCHGRVNQLWYLRFHDLGGYEIVDAKAGKCLDVERYSTRDRANVQLYSCHGGTNQQWFFRASGRYYEIINGHSGKCLDVTGASTENKADIQQYACHGGTNQLWY